MNKDTDFPDFCASQESRKKEVWFHGLRISPGIAFGIVQKHEYIDSFRLMSETLHKISAEDVNEEIALFDSAVKKTSEQISDLIQNHEKNGAD